jgi:Flp pilus assembly protein TadD
MKKQSLYLAVMLLVALGFGFVLTPAPSMAITKVTPTPDASEMDIEALLERAMASIEAQAYSDAISDLNAVLEMDNQLWDAYVYRGFAHGESGDTDRAIDDYTRAISIRPYDWQTYSLRGDLYILSGDLAQANLDYDQSLYLNPRYVQAYAGKALLTLQRGDETISLIYQGLLEALGAGNDQTIELLSNTIDLVDTEIVPPALGYVYYNRSNAHISDSNWTDALDDINTAISLQPEMQDYYMARGFIYSETDELALAAPDFYQRMTLVELSTVEDTIEFGQTVPIEMDYGVVARLTFTASEGQAVTLTARDSLGVGVDPLLVLLDPEGNPIAGNDDGGGEFDSLLDDYVIPADGTYTALVSHANGGFVGTVTVSLK